jgi:hypothetical protein
MGNSPFGLRSVVWARRLNSEVEHHGKRFDSGVRTANEKVQFGGDRVRDRGLNDIVEFMAIFAIRPRAISDARGNPTGYLIGSYSGRRGTTNKCFQFEKHRRRRPAGCRRLAQLKKKYR